MIREERELRKFTSMMFALESDEVRDDCNRLITALVRACYEDAAKVADSFHEPPYPSTTSSMYTVPQKIANAIRRKGK